jgi:hypothetical protein
MLCTAIRHFFGDSVIAWVTTLRSNRYANGRFGLFMICWAYRRCEQVIRHSALDSRLSILRAAPSPVAHSFWN